MKLTERHCELERALWAENDSVTKFVDKKYTPTNPNGSPAPHAVNHSSWAAASDEIDHTATPAVYSKRKAPITHKALVKTRFSAMTIYNVELKVRMWTGIDTAQREEIYRKLRHVLEKPVCKINTTGYMATTDGVQGVSVRIAETIIMKMDNWGELNKILGQSIDS